MSQLLMKLSIYLHNECGIFVSHIYECVFDSVEIIWVKLDLIWKSLFDKIPFIASIFLRCMCTAWIRATNEIREYTMLFLYPFHVYVYLLWYLEYENSVTGRLINGQGSNTIIGYLRNTLHEKKKTFI